MVAFVIGKPVKTREPFIVVDGDMPVGRHRFRLEVVSGDGKTSHPDEVVVRVQRSIAPSRAPISSEGT